MSQRRSARLQQQQPSGSSALHSGDRADKATPAAKKRGRKSKTSDDAATSAADVMPPPPATPNIKRRRVAKDDDPPPPVTPTPSAIGFMTSSSNLRPSHRTDDIDETRPAEPHHTNATLVTPGGTQVPPPYSNFEESPSRPSDRPVTTSATLLEDACQHLISVDPKLKDVIEKHHCRIFSAEGLSEEIDPFRALVSGIIAQQVSGAAAKSIKNKFIALFPPKKCPNGFPTPHAVVASSVPRMREAGLSERKAEYVYGLAEKFVHGYLTADVLMNGSDEEVMEKLVAVRGLGAWSVEMFMCFALKRMDILSTGDLGVQRGMAAYMGRDVAKLKAKGGGKWKYMSEKDMIEIAEKFRPYRTLFMWYMWRIEDVDVAAIQDND